MTVNEVSTLFSKAAQVLIDHKQELCAIDGETGDGDHGVAIAKVANAIINISEKNGYNNLCDYFSQISAAIMSINGGSCIPLCANIFDGMSESVENLEEDGSEMIKAAFKGALEGLRFISSAKPGDKTMLDALYPAVQAAVSCQGDEREIFFSAAQAAHQGSEATRNMVAKFGRAKDLKEASIGFLDAGSVSVSLFINALSICYP